MSEIIKLSYQYLRNYTFVLNECNLQWMIMNVICNGMMIQACHDI